MLSHNGLLYVGTENTNGAELWTYNSASAAWTKRNTFAEDAAVAELAVYDGRMYAGTWDFADSYKLHCSDDTNAWNDVTPVFPGSDSLSNLGVMQLRDFKGKLYLGTLNYVDGFTLLRSDTPESASAWEVITTDGMGNPDNAYTWASEEFAGKMYIGTFNHGLRGGLYAPLPIPLDGRAQLLASDNGTDWVTVIDDGFGSPFTYGIRTMIVNDEGRLVCGTASNFLVVDLLSELNRCGVSQKELYLCLADAMGEQCAAALLTELGAVRSGDWIGCQVYASDQIIPEPATLTLLVAGGLVPLLKRRRR